MSLVNTFVEVTLEDPQNFLKIKETLTRIGVSSKTDKKLYQSCHILHKRGKYYIVHFKELFALDGLSDSTPEHDIGRRNTIANLLEEWGLCKIVNRDSTKTPICPINHIKIISYSERKDWELIPKYSIGIKKTVDKNRKKL
jgi:hypothetical protein